MNIGAYEEHVSIVKDLKMADSFYEVREPFKEGFEEIYEKAKEENVTISTAKDFLNSLSKDELSTLQNYTLLVNEINVDSLSNEGAYNLLLHHYEKYDFDSDGIVQNGEARNLDLIPPNIPSDEKRAFVNSLNEMDEKDRFIAMIMTFPPRIYIEGVTNNAPDEKVYDYDSIVENIDRLLNPLPGEYVSSSIQETLKLFKEVFEKNYDEITKKSEELNANLSNQSNISKAKINS
jgi:hypothetical protein